MKIMIVIFLGSKDLKEIILHGCKDVIDNRDFMLLSEQEFVKSIEMKVLFHESLEKSN